MHYQRSYLFFFNSPHWPTNLMAGCGCVLIPLVGWTLLIGYLIEVVESLHKKPGQDYPAFDLNRVGDYLARGARSAVVQLVVLLPVVLFACVSFWVATRIGTPPKGLSTLAKVTASGLPPVVFLLAVALNVLLLPFTLYLGCAGPLPEVSVWRFAQDFLKHVWREALLAQVFVLVTGLALAAVGLAFCGFGIPFAVALAAFSQYHLLGQLYELYVQRGGAALAMTAIEPATSGA